MNALSAAEKARLDAENRALLVDDLRNERLVWKSRPVMVEIATNNYCNLRCVMCPQAYDMPYMQMDKAVFRRVCDEIFPYAGVVTPSAGSEPLIGDFDLVAELCRKYRVEINLITNATLLTAAKFRSVAECVSRVQISFDSPDREIFERVRAEGDFDASVRNIRAVNSMPERSDIEMMMNFVLLKENVEDLPKMVRFAADLGMDSLAVLKLIHQVPNAIQYDPKSAYDDEEIDVYIDEAIEAARRAAINLHVHIDPPRFHFFNTKKFRTQRTTDLIGFMQKNRPDFCFNAASYAKISPNGDVFPCCISPPDLVMGNVNEKSFEEIWNGPMYRQLRREMFSGKWRESCATCPYIAMVKRAPAEAVV